LLSSPPLLVVEVLSRSTRHIDLGRKRQRLTSGTTVGPVEIAVTVADL
jgi:Uma2 family endonuclease